VHNGAGNTTHAERRENDMEQRSAEWHEARKGRITASMVGAILGVSPNMTRADAMRAMVRAAHGAEQEFTGNIATEHGVFHESGAIAEYMLETGQAVEPASFITREDWAGCSPDGLFGADGGLEVKCPFSLRKTPAPVTFKPLSDQPHYYAQVQFSLWVTGRAYWVFYQWAPAGSAVERIALDDGWINQNLPKLRQFYAEYLDELKSPERHLEPRRAEIDTPEAQRMIAEWDELTEAIERAEARKKDVLAQMVRIAGERNAVFGGRNLTKVSRAGSVSYAKALAKYAPDADLEPFRGKPTEYWQVK
jgi:putative phage-type endonuclease